MEVNVLFKQRSITSCMKASYDLLTSHPKAFIKQSWTTQVPLAILLAVVLYFLLPNKSLHDWGVYNPWASFIVQTIIYAATIVMAIVAFWHLLPRQQFCPKGEKRKMGKSTLGTAQLFSQLGALDGDPLGTPGYFTPLLLLILVITCYLFVGILSWLGITLAYQYGSYKVQDEEKEKINKHINIESTK